MTNKPSKAELAAEYHSQLYYYRANGERLSAGPNPQKGHSFVVGVRWTIEQAEQLAVKPDANSTTQFEPFVLLKDLKGLV